MFEIENNVPLPSPRRKGSFSKELRETLIKLDINQSFVISVEDENKATSKVGLVYQEGKKQGKRFVTRFFPEEKQVRIWRLK